MEKYVLFTSLTQACMEHSRFNECYLLQALDGQRHFDSACFMPMDYTEK
jgi:hypothetical protein